MRARSTSPGGWSTISLPRDWRGMWTATEGLYEKVQVYEKPYEGVKVYEKLHQELYGAWSRGRARAWRRSLRARAWSTRLPYLVLFTSLASQSRSHWTAATIPQFDAIAKLKKGVHEFLPRGPGVHY